MIVVREFNTPLPVIARTSRWKTSKNLEDFNNTINSFDLINISKTPHSTITEHTFF